MACRGGVLAFRAVWQVSGLLAHHVWQGLECVAGSRDVWESGMGARQRLDCATGLRKASREAAFISAESVSLRELKTKITKRAECVHTGIDSCGKKYINEYTLLVQLGVGAYGTVYQVVNTYNGQVCV